MAYNHACAFFLIALIFFATANPLAHAQLTPPGSPGLPTTSVNVTGRLCCTFTGNCAPGSPPVAGAVVDVNCTGLTSNVPRIGQGITNGNGSFSIAVNLVSGDLCVATVQLSSINATVCQVLSNTGGALFGVVNVVTGLLGQLIATVSNLIRVGA